ncbi:MAG: hypothetical protein L0Z53_25435 [Acidobacteriales bacterium]|nr:hypothetical protein [Terriglobales bacterium]
MRTKYRCTRVNRDGLVFEVLESAGKNAPDVATLKFTPPDLRAIEFQARKRRLGLFTIAENMSSRGRKVTPSDVWQAFLEVVERRVEDSFEDGARHARREVRAQVIAIARSVSGPKQPPPAAPAMAPIRRAA